METIKNVAERTRQMIEGDEAEVIKFDPMIIVIIIGVLIGIINMLKICFPDEPEPGPNTLGILRKPKLHHYGRIRRLVRKECKAKGVRYDKEIYAAVLKARHEVTQDELVKAYGEVN